MCFPYPIFLALGNTEDDLFLENNAGEAIHTVLYEISWYGDPDKDGGAWSLELINPENLCASASNWIASNDPQGGTPSKQNSVIQNIPDVEGPQLISALPVNDGQNNKLRLTFSETYDINTITNINQLPCRCAGC